MLKNVKLFLRLCEITIQSKGTPGLFAISMFLAFPNYDMHLLSVITSFLVLGHLFSSR